MNKEVFQSLRAVASQVRSLPELFESDADREWLVIDACGVHADFSRQNIDRRLFDELVSAAVSVGITEKFSSMSAGEHLNETENRAVGHLALRGSATNEVMSSLANQHMQQAMGLAKSIRNGLLTGATGKVFTDVVNLGIGGSDLGPAMAATALRRFTSGPNVHFVSNIDSSDLDDCLKNLSPDTTLFVVCSKTFTTTETMTNAQSARTWLRESGIAVDKHFVAVTAQPENAAQWGIASDRCLQFFDWVGGRFSISSVVGFSLMCAIGEEHFQDFLTGMNEMDKHVLSSAPEMNLAVIHGLIWWLNAAVLDRSSVAVIPYSYDLRRLPSYLQQLVMESNGKSVETNGAIVTQSTSPVVWGETGTNSQHAFFQMLHQGTQVVPVELIGVVRTLGTNDEAHDQLNVNLFAQAEALAAGQISPDGHRNFSGNRPSTVLMLSDLSPHSLGALIAMYEHSTAVQGWLMGVNSFDQWGVELGKVLARSVGETIKSEAPADKKTMTHPLVDWYINARKKLLSK